jgi:hypothetical protein
MAVERDEKDLTRDVAIDDESASEVTGGTENSQEHGSPSEFVNPERFKSRRFKSRWLKR